MQQNYFTQSPQAMTAHDWLICRAVARQTPLAEGRKLAILARLQFESRVSGKGGHGESLRDLREGSRDGQ